MVQQKFVMGGRDDIVVKSARFDRFGILLDKEELVCVELMQTSDCLGCFERLSLRKMGRSSMSKIFATVNKQVNTALLRSTHQPTMVSGAFITEGQSPRKRRVMHKQLRIRKQRLQKFGGFLRLKRAMKVRDQVGRRQ